MLKLAMEGQPGFEISTTEVEREGPSYTVDTLREIRRIVDKNTEIFFIVGWDTLEELPLWKEPEELVRLCRLVAVSRPGHQRPDIEALEHAVPGIVKSTILLEIPPIAISSTEIRA
jgi:nicotinate-nucleotide adenylyltransferase